MARQIEKVQKEEHRTRSELVREAWHRYFESRYDLYRPTKVERAAIDRGRAEASRGEYVSLHQLHDELAVARQLKRKKTARKSA